MDEQERKALEEELQLMIYLHKFHIENEVIKSDNERVEYLLDLMEMIHDLQQKLKDLER